MSFFFKLFGVVDKVQETTAEFQEVRRKASNLKLYIQGMKGRKLTVEDIGVLCEQVESLVESAKAIKK